VITEQALLLLLGFFLTSVVGGALGYYFQNRTWNHQFFVNRGVAEWDAATRLFQEVSQLCDRRLYRMRRVVWGLNDRPRDALDDRLAEYKDALFAYNDKINYNLAMVESYFGVGLRNDLEADVFANFARLGRDLDRALLSAEAANVEPLEENLEKLSDRLYSVNVRMIRALQDGRIGSRNEVN
jgi:hypothetical protein